MKRFPILGALLLLPALAMLGMVGCDNKPKKTEPTGKPATEAPSEDKKDKGGELTGKLEATVKGVVHLDGKTPEMKEDPRIAEHKTDAKFCLTAPEKFKIKQEWIVGKDHELANVVVWLVPAGGKKFKTDDEVKKLCGKTVTIDQPFCNYDPHTVALWNSVDKLQFLNSAPVPHNVKVAFAKLGNPDMNMKPKPNDGPPTKSEELVFKGGGNETVVDAVCSMHGWMNSKIVLFSHPYAAVTKPDGSFEIPHVPVGDELIVYMWHESAGSDPSKTRMEATKHKMEKGDNDLKVLKYTAK